MSAQTPTWPLIPLGKLGRWLGGGTPSKRNPGYWTNGTIPWVSPKDMKTARISDTQDRITSKAVQESATNLVGPGSVLVVVRSGILKHTLPIAVTDRELALNQDLKALCPSEGFDPKYIALVLKAFERDILHRCCKNGVTVQSIILPSLLKFKIPTPPLVRQKEIVIEVEKQFSKLESGLTALRRAEVNLRRLHDAVLWAAAEGRLISPGPASHENAFTILDGISVSRHSKGQKAKRPTGKLPGGWAWTTLEEIADIKGGITKDQKRTHGKNSRAVPYLRVANVQRGYLDLADVRMIRAPEERISELLLKPGDILLNEGGDRDKLGRGWVWNAELPECIHQNHVFRARLRSSQISPKYISWYANSIGQNFFFTEGKHTTNLASISLSKLKRLPIPLPPANEQVRIVEEVDRQLSTINELQGVVQTNLDRTVRLKEAILNRYVGRNRA